jgi:hypothetical protein
LRTRKGDRRLVEEQTVALIATCTLISQRLQAAKHASELDVTAVRSYLMAAEALLIQLFIEW